MLYGESIIGACVAPSTGKAGWSLPLNARLARWVDTHGQASGYIYWEEILRSYDPYTPEESGAKGDLEILIKRVPVAGALIENLEDNFVALFGGHGGQLLFKGILSSLAGRFQLNCQELALSVFFLYSSAV